MPDILPELLRQILRNFNYHELLTVYLVNNLWYETAKSELKLRVSKFLSNPSRQASNLMTVDFPYHPKCTLLTKVYHIGSSLPADSRPIDII